jgi:cardiolipin synthase
MNASSSHRYFWRDTHVRIAGPAVQILQKQFLVDWYTSSAREESLFDAENNRRFFPRLLPGAHAGVAHEWLTVEPETDVPVQIVSSGPDDPRNDEIRDALVQMISRARESVYIQTPYFTPDNAFYTALKIAALSGIDVRIIIPGTWDKWYVRLAAMTYVEELLEAGVRFWHYPGFIHAKMAVIDEHISSIGSTNVDTRSFSLHFELNAFFYSASLGKKCANIFRADQEVSREAKLERFSSASPIRRAVWNFFRLFSPLF